MGRPLRIVIVEDSQDDTLLLVRELVRSGYDPTYERVDSREAMSAALTKQRWDVVLADYSLPKFSAPAALALLKELGMDIPFIIVSGTIDEETAVASLKAGADDFMLKSNLKRLAPAVERELREVEVRRARKQAEEAMVHSETQLRAVLETVGEGIITIDSAGHIVMVNREVQRIWGHPQEELIGKSIQILMPEKYRQAHATGLKRYLETGISQALGKRLELEGLKRDGSTFPLEILIAETKVGENLFFTAAVSDISERKRSEQAISQLASIVESSDDMIFSMTWEGIIITWNSGAQKTYGYAAEEIRGRPISVLIPPDRFYEVKHILERLKLGQAIEHFETVLVTKDGRPIDVDLTISPVKDGGGRITGASVIARNITERKLDEERLILYARELERSNNELQQFAYISSHDLQEPLRTVANYVQLLAKRYKGKLDTDADEFIGYAVDGAVRMQRLIEALLRYSRVDTQGKPFEPTNCDDVLTEALENLSMSIEESGARVTRDPLPRVMADKLQMVQLFQNLIGNAIKFRKNEVLCIHVAARPIAGNVHNGEEESVESEAEETLPNTILAHRRLYKEWLFSVRDNGIGIDSQYADRIFMIFQRLHTQAEYPGAGIGLSICKKIVERHGGRIWMKSEPGKGSTFYFTIPTQSREREPGILVSHSSLAKTDA